MKLEIRSQNSEEIIVRATRHVAETLRGQVNDFKVETGAEKFPSPPAECSRRYFKPYWKKMDDPSFRLIWK